MTFSIYVALFDPPTRTGGRGRRLEVLRRRVRPCRGACAEGRGDRHPGAGQPQLRAQRARPAPRGARRPRHGRPASLADDPLVDQRQLAVVDSHGRTANHTGTRCIDWKGHEPGERLPSPSRATCSPGPRWSKRWPRRTTPAEAHVGASTTLRCLPAGEAAGGDQLGLGVGGDVRSGRRGPPTAAGWTSARTSASTTASGPITELGRLLDLHFLYFQRPSPTRCSPIEGALADGGHGRPRRPRLLRPAHAGRSRRGIRRVVGSQRLRASARSPASWSPIIWAILQEQAGAGAPGGRAVPRDLLGRRLRHGQSRAGWRRGGVQGDVRGGPRPVGRRRCRGRRHAGVPRPALRLRGVRRAAGQSRRPRGDQRAACARATRSVPGVRCGRPRRGGRRPSPVSTLHAVGRWRGAGDSWAVQGNILAGGPRGGGDGGGVSQDAEEPSPCA